MQTNSSRRSKRGFTLQEMLLVIAIFAILAGLAIPGVIALQRSLHMKKLDEYARQIYVAAQNELTEMKSSGRLELFAKELEQKKLRLDQKPQDYPDPAESEDADSWKDLFYVNSADEVCTNYLLRVDDSLRTATEHGGEFILELNPISGDVYSAFYAEDGFTYDQVQALADRKKATRQKADPQLGYYNGSDEYGTVGMPAAFYPRINVVNGEELAVKVSCDNLMALRRTQRYLTLKLTVTDKLGTSKEFEYKGGQDFFVNSDSITVTEILDSIADGQRFADLLPGLHAGDDLTIKASLEYDDQNNDIHISGKTTVDQINSLFAAKTVDADGTTTISVDHVRHLNNLRTGIYTDAQVGTKVEQTAPISFLFSDWEKGTDYVSSWDKQPMDRFTAIRNDTLFAGGSYDGKENTLNGFVFAEGEGGYAALFDTLDHTTLTDVRLTDCAATGTNAAVLAGSLTSCVVENCGAYLNTEDELLGAYNNMDERRLQYRVNGNGGAAGGLIAVAEGGSITSSFGAVDVNGTGSIGGLVGRINGTAIDQCYGSGNITALNDNGGFHGGLVGRMGSGAVSDCYASGNVTAPGYSGGLAGRADGGTIQSSMSYGKVSTDGADGTDSNGGGFVGGLASSGARISDCTYLSQASYNNSYTISSSGVKGQPYAALRDENAGADGYVQLSTPYQTALLGTGFPFPLCKYGENQMRHYADWPQPYQLQTSLVYYERYETPDQDGNYYGYYARTSLTGGDASNSDNWVVDSLRDEACIEDGYALMTVYRLASFEYTLDNGTGTTSAKKRISINESDNALDTASKDEAALMLKNASLVFSNDENNSYKETTITNAWVYRLPFGLQINDRMSSNTFWEKLTVTGYSVLGNAEMFTNQVFYYCPDFAKNAVNPAVGGGNTKPPEPGGAESPVYVRSARQLNALSRSIYYWNTTTGGRQIQFIQETDIDFGKYIPVNTAGKKIYCGVEFDLMNTETDGSNKNKYANQPIGYSNEVHIPNPNKPGEYLESNFQNSYDGRSHKIIDYCQDNKTYRFAGLFGEVSQCIIKNVVMVASDPSNAENKAYVKSTYSGRGEPGVGALVGLVYMAPNGLNKKEAVIENCAVMGYYIEYSQSANQNYALGGLAGFNFGMVRNCSAVCQLNYTVSTSTNTEGFVGGLVGSLNGVGTIENSYAGGAFEGTNYVKIGGVCGGFLDIYGYNQGAQLDQRKMQVLNCYSYCTIDTQKLTPHSPYKPLKHLFGTVVTKGNKGDEEIDNGIKVSNCYYLTDTIVNGTTLYDAASSDSIGYSRAQLCAQTFGESDIAVGVHTGKAAASGIVPSAENSFHYDVALDGKIYPFPALVRKVSPDGQTYEYAHYGDWPDHGETPTDPDDLKLTQPTYLVYYEEYADGSYGVYSLGEDGDAIDSLSDTEEITGTGYGFLSNTTDFKVGTDAQGNWLPYGVNGSAGAAFTDVLSDDLQSGYQLLKGNPELIHTYALATTLYWKSGADATIYHASVNEKFAKGIYDSTSPNEYPIRTAWQLQNSSGKSNAYTFVFERDITADASTGMLDNSQGGAVYQGNGHTITGLTRPLFYINYGTVKDLRLENVNINLSGDAAAMAVSNGGTISGCYVSGNVTSQNGNAAGLAVNGDGTSAVDRCAVKGSVSGANAAGVVYNFNRGTMTNSYFDGNISATQSAAGFFLSGYGTARNCYTKADFSRCGAACTGFGFAKREGSDPNAVTDCYYASHQSLSTGLGTSCASINWDAALDPNGIPNENWPGGIKRSQAG